MARLEDVHATNEEIMSKLKAYSQERYNIVEVEND